jgi:diadenylate cyclase
MQVGLIAVIIVFQPELRRALEQMGNSKIGHLIFLNNFNFEDSGNTIGTIVAAAGELSEHKTGALMVLERGTKINDIVSTGVQMESRISKDLIVNIFQPNTPLHDGAIVVRENRIMAASCLLPLSQKNLGTEFGTRHRAALGISETSDSVVIVISEETGKISLAINGAFTRNLSAASLEKALLRLESRDKKENKTKIKSNDKKENKKEKNTKKEGKTHHEEKNI